MEDSTKTWLPMEPLTENLCCSERSVYSLKESGLLKAGEHFYAVGGRSLAGKHVYWLEGIRKVLLEQTAAAAKARAIRTPETYDQEHIQELVKKRASR